MVGIYNADGSLRTSFNDGRGYYNADGGVNTSVSNGLVAHTSVIDLKSFGTASDGVTDDSAVVQAAINALPNGGTIVWPAGITRIATQIVNQNKPVSFVGAVRGQNTSYGSRILIDTGASSGFILQHVDGTVFQDLLIYGNNLTGGHFIELTGTAAAGNYGVSFERCRFQNGYQAFLVQRANTIRFRDCSWSAFTGAYVLKFNGIDSTNHTDPIEFTNCGIAAGTGYTTTDNIVFDGQGGSAKFLACYIGTGRRGISILNTVGTTTPPKFFYFDSGGFENCGAEAIYSDAGVDFKIANAYASIDGLTDVFRFNANSNQVKIVNTIIRGGGRHGVNVAGSNVKISNCAIGNNGRSAVADYAIPVTNCVNNGSGLIRITTNPPATYTGGYIVPTWETGDRIVISGVSGTTEANGTWTVTAIDSVTYDLQASTFTNAFTGAGTAYRKGSGVCIQSTATQISISDCTLGDLSDGLNRQEYGIITSSVDTLITDNDLRNNLGGTVLDLSAAAANKVFRNNLGYSTKSGCFVGVVASPTTVDSPFSNILFLNGKKVLITAVTASIDSGTSVQFALRFGSTPIGTLLTATTTVTTTNLSTPLLLDATTAPKALVIRLATPTGTPTNLRVQYDYIELT